MCNKAVLAALASFIIPLPGFARPDPFAQSPVIELVMYFECDHSPLAIAELKRVVEEAMTPLGLQWEWRLGSRIVQGETFNHPIIVRFKGKCQVLEEPAGGPTAAGALGEAESVDGKLISFARIQCDRIRTLIRHKLRGLSVGQRQALFGRALGRVLAHELYHILAETTRHSRRGLAAADFSAEDLTDERFEFQRSDWEVFNRALGRPVTAGVETAGGMD